MSSKNNGTKRGGGPGGGHGRFMQGGKAKNVRKSIFRLLKFIGEQKTLLFVAISLNIISVVISSIAPAYLGNSITYYLERELNIPVFVQRMGMLALMYIAVFITSAIAHIAGSYMGNKVLFRMRKKFFDKIQKLSISYFDKAGIGDLISRLTNDIETIQHVLNNSFMQFVNAVSSIVLILAAMFILNWQLSVVLLLTFPVMVAVAMIIGKRMRKASKIRHEKIGKLSENIEESVSGMKIIQSFHREEEEFNKFEKSNSEARTAAVKMESVAFLMFPVMNFINAFSLVLVLGIGGSLIISNPNVFSIGLLTSFIVYSRKFFEPIRQLSQVYSMIQSALAGAERVFEVFDSEEEIALVDNPIELENVYGVVKFNDVTFGYEKDKTILNNISFETVKGESVAIVGPTGAGKTTLINLLSRFYDVDSGEIQIDGNPIKHLELSAYRKKLGIVLQEPFFFATSIRENILYGNPEATDEQMITASKMANAHHFISCLPEGYDTKLTERGLNISQGERQLLAIARIILVNPSILILDEATSNIDSLTEAHIQQAIARLMEGRTSFVIAHRLSTIKKADRIFYIDKQRIVEQGSHADLLKQKGLYYELYQSQYAV